MFIYWLDLILADERYNQFYLQGTQTTFTINGIAVSPAPGATQS